MGTSLRTARSGVNMQGIHRESSQMEWLRDEGTSHHASRLTASIFVRSIFSTFFFIITKNSNNINIISDTQSHHIRSFA